MKKKNVSRRKATIIAATTLAVITATGAGSLAYLTDAETSTATYTSGDVKIDLVEANYNEAKMQKMVPNQEEKMDPVIMNTGINDAVVFARVTVPCANVTGVSDDGTKGVRKDQELVFFKDTDDNITKHENNFDANWVLLDDDGSAGLTDTDVADGSRTYIFGYKNTIKGSKTSQDENDKKTSALYDKVQLLNVLEDDIDPSVGQKIKVEAFAIQADNILHSANGGEAIDLSGDISEDVLTEVYNIAFKQATMGKGKDATDNVQTNIDAQDADTNGSKDLAGQDL